MANERIIQVVKHIYPGQLSLFEIQVWSNNDNKWHMMHTCTNKASINAIVEKYYAGLEFSTIDCIHAREN